MEKIQEKWPATADPDSAGHSSDETVGGNNQTAIGPNVAQTVGTRVAEKEHIKEESGKRELKEDDCESELGYAFSEKKKWWILTVIFLVQTSMNFNTSLYSNGLIGISEKFNVSEQAARIGAAIFLITYAFGCELWAPWSEEFGRKPILQASLFLTNIWTLPVVLAPNFGSILVGRALGGLSTAGGSVTLGMIADLYDSDRQQYAVAYM
jgi:sugar phosphate permease